MAKSSKKKVIKTIKKQKKTPKKQNPRAIDTAEIRDFISFIARSGLNEVDIETEKLKLHVKRDANTNISHSGIPITLPKETPPPPALPKPNAPEDVPEKLSAVEIKSPMIGTFYRASTPTSSPFINVGDTIKKGQVVCIIEAMKLFNEIESEVSGTVVKIIAENASPVEYEQTLFLVEAN